MMETPNNRIALTRIQRLIGHLMLQSKQTSPTFYLESAADLTELTAMRKPFSKEIGVRVTTNDFFFCALARAIPQYPLMAGKLDETGQCIDISSQIGVGFAVSAPQGLVVPVIKDVQGKSLLQIAAESNALLKKARSNRLMPDDLYGENVVLSGLGMYGVTSFFAIAPPCAAAIVSLGNLHDTIKPAEAGFVVRKKMCIGLAVNSCYINEVYAAQFLRCVIDQLEDPSSLT
jgi:pyruvate dehydrogenase E2 component (dihydrolipoamide acetyltransferase)